MDKKEEEIISMHYQMEKTDVKQQELEERLMSISEDLKKSKNIRNFYFTFIIILICLIAIGGYYWAQDNDVDLSGEYEDNQKALEQLKLLNDSLRHEVVRLKSDISNSSIFGSLDSISGNNKDTITDQSKLDFERRYCYVNKVFERNDAMFAEVDFIEYYQGKKAVMKAKEYGEAEFDIDKNGDTLYFLYKNYYINNINSNTKILEIDDRAQVRIDNINQISRGFPLKAFQKIITDKPILILETYNDIVYKITEKKLP